MGSTVASHPLLGYAAARSLEQASAPARPCDASLWTTSRSVGRDRAPGRRQHSKPTRLTPRPLPGWTRSDTPPATGATRPAAYAASSTASRNRLGSDASRVSKSKGSRSSPPRPSSAPVDLRSLCAVRCGRAGAGGPVRSARLYGQDARTQRARPRARSGRSFEAAHEAASRGCMVESTFAPPASVAWSRASVWVGAWAPWAAADGGSARCSASVERRA
jgi:hypothetical protein